jgi:deoxyribonuclease-1
MDAGLDTQTRAKLEDLATQFSQSRAAVLRQVMRWGLHREHTRPIDDTAPSPVLHLFFMVDAELHRHVKDAAQAAGVDVAPWLRHMTRQITTADFPQSWQARNTEERKATAPRSHDSRQYWKRAMLRLDDPASERLDELATYFDAPHAEVIRQLIVQATLEDFPHSWHLAVAERRRGQGRSTFYCDCAYDGTTVDVQSCGYQPQKPSKRARQLEWEHVVPAEAFGQSFPEWRDGHPACVDRKGKAFKGRNCAGKMAIPYRYIEADLYNLQPAIGEVNQWRANYSMAMIDGEARRFGPCDLEIEDRKIEPRPNIRGDIARTYFYMDVVYPGRGVISEKNRKLFEAWDREDPVDDWERERVRRIERLQRNTNTFVK